MATCLELGIVVTSPTAEKIKDEMSDAVQLYIEGVIEVVQQGHKYEFVPVKWYYLKRIIFDIRMWFENRNNTPRMNDKDVDMWSGTRFVPC